MDRVIARVKKIPHGAGWETRVDWVDPIGAPAKSPYPMWLVTGHEDEWHLRIMNAALHHGYLRREQGAELTLYALPSEYSWAFEESRFLAFARGYMAALCGYRKTPC